MHVYENKPCITIYNFSFINFFFYFRVDATIAGNERGLFFSKLFSQYIFCTSIEMFRSVIVES